MKHLFLVLFITFNLNALSQFSGIKYHAGSYTNEQNGDNYVYGKSNDNTFSIYRLDRELNLLDSTTITNDLFDEGNIDFIYSPIGIELVVKNKSKEQGSIFLDTDLNVRQKTETDDYIRYFMKNVNTWISDGNNSILVLSEISQIIDAKEYSSLGLNPIGTSKYFSYKGQTKIIYFNNNGNSNIVKEQPLDVDGYFLIESLSDTKNGVLKIIASVTKKENPPQYYLYTIDFNNQNLTKTYEINGDNISSGSIFYWESSDDFYYFKYTEENSEPKSCTYVTQLFKLVEDKFEPITNSSYKATATSTVKQDLYVFTPYIIKTPKNIHIISSIGYYHDIYSSNRSFDNNTGSYGYSGFKTYRFSLLNSLSVLETKISANDEIKNNYIDFMESPSKFDPKEADKIRLSRNSNGWVMTKQFILDDQVNYLYKIYALVGNSGKDLQIVNFNDHSVKTQSGWEPSDRFPVNEGEEITAGTNLYSYGSTMIQSYDSKKILIIKIVDVKKPFVGNQMTPEYEVQIINTSELIKD